jgi:hypothetical protein
MSNSIVAIKSRASILDVWSALGGAPLRHGRGVAFWRKVADGYNVSLDARQNLWHDFVTGEGGDVIALVETVRGCDFKQALQWLADHVGVNLSPVPGRRAAPSDPNWRVDLARAEWWLIAAVHLAEYTLDEILPDAHAERQAQTQFLVSIRLGEASLVAQYRSFRECNPQLTAAMVLAGSRSEARSQRRVALRLTRRDLYGAQTP